MQFIEPVCYYRPYYQTKADPGSHDKKVFLHLDMLEHIDKWMSHEQILFPEHLVIHSRLMENRF